MRAVSKKKGGQSECRNSKSGPKIGREKLKVLLYKKTNVLTVFFPSSKKKEKRKAFLG